MIGVTVEIGSNLLVVIAPVASAAIIMVQNRFANKQLKTNGGTSLRDVVDRIESKQQQHAAISTTVLAAQAEQNDSITEIKIQVAANRARLDRIENPSGPVPVTIAQPDPVAVTVVKGTT